MELMLMLKISMVKLYYTLLLKRETKRFVKLLLECGANIDAQDKGVLHFAVEKGAERLEQLLEGHPELVDILSELCASIDYKYVYCCTPVHIAAQKCRQDEGGNTVLRLVVDEGHKQVKLLVKSHIEVFDILSKFCAGINTKDEYGSTPLHIAAQKGHLEVVKVLLKFGAVIDCKDEGGRTALHIASKEGHKQTVVALLEHRSDVNIMSKHSDFTDEYVSAPLHIAAQEGRPEVVDVLLKFGASINSKDGGGRTALHIAAQKGHVEVVKFLLKFGAGIDAKDEGGRTALHIASQGRHKQTVIALLDHGSDINIMSKNNKTPLGFAMAGINSFYYEALNYDFNHDLGTLDILKCHVVKMKTANLFVSKENLLSVSKYAMRDFQERCEEEIASMKSEKVGNTNVSFYDILTKGMNQLAMCAGNESTVQILRSDDYRVRFPIYAGIINSNFRKGERRKELLEQGLKIFQSFCNNLPALPHDCTAEIFSYLSDEDIRILIHACKPVSVSSPKY